MLTLHDSCLTERHLTLFARIVRCFARYEHLIDGAATTLSRADATCFSLLTRGYDFRARRTTLLDMLRQVGYPTDRYDRISAQLMLPYTYSMLLHDIVHSEWTRHVPSGGIQPAWIFDCAPTVLPLRDWSDAGVEDPLPRAADEYAYTLDQLETVADTLSEGHRDFASYLQETGLVPVTR
ncbi:hypothetical protein [Pandoraea sp. SD6-2]|uniref:hypothetical protein n=1 Tax=Pandoraea sp. SD6-2 TaxID=1286093 RepID=UPI00032F200B|nr:hypothetical protein [Pandoraea sp. SD6-2]EON15263.1 hypothetical protein C266_02221 [Pandoraea sp. SD6-2]